MENTEFVWVLTLNGAIKTVFLIAEKEINAFYHAAGVV